MHQIGRTAAGNFVLELGPDEFERLGRLVGLKTGKGTLVASMDLQELAAEVGPRIRKSRPHTSEKARNFVAAMFQFSGGIESERLERLFAELSKRRVIRETGGKVAYPDDSAT